MYLAVIKYALFSLITKVKKIEIKIKALFGIIS